MIVTYVKGEAVYNGKPTNKGNYSTLVRSVDGNSVSYARVVWTGKHPEVVKGDLVSAEGKPMAVINTLKDGAQRAGIVVTVE